jgi:hypothetical protein
MTNNEPGERRSKWRFPIQLEVRYTILRRGKAWAAGTGRTSDMSSRGIGFTADRPLRVGAVVEIVMIWPATPENGCQLLLVAIGRSVRSQGKWAACTIGRFEFRTVAPGVHR